MYLADTSAYMQARLNARAADRFLRLAQDGQLAVCPVVMFEILYTARNLREYTTLRDELALLPVMKLEDPLSAVVVQDALARRGQHRTPVNDVIIAATAAQHRATILHHDSDFERLTEVTGGRHEWIIERGSGHQA